MAASTNTVKGSDIGAELTAESDKTIEKLIKADLMKDLRTEMNTATEPLAPAAKTAARQLPSGRPRRKTPGGSLRNQVANAISRKIKISANSVLIVITGQNKGDKSNLSRVLEGEIPWEHPTFGHDPTVNQKPEPFFYRTLDAMMPEVAAKIEDVLKKLEQRL